MNNSRLRSSAVVILVGCFLLAISACDTVENALTGMPRAQANSTRLKLLVSEPGIYRLTAAELAARGMAVPDPLTYEALRLSDGGQAVPYLLDGDGIVFFGRAPDSRYAAKRPYILEAGQPGLAIEERTPPALSGPARNTWRKTVRLEENHLYLSEARQDDQSDVWFWAKVPQQQAFSTEFTLPDTPVGTATIRVNAWGFTRNPEIDPDHDLDLLVNGQKIASIAWDGQTAHTAEFELPESALKAGRNTLSLDNTAEGASFLDIVDLNWLELSYETAAALGEEQLLFEAGELPVEFDALRGSPLVLAVNDPQRPQQISALEGEDGVLRVQAAAGEQIAAANVGGMFTPEIQPISESSWLRGDQQADLIVITTSELAPALAPLIAARQEQGLTVAVVPVDQIYDEFGFGAPSPESIRGFVSHAYHEWREPRPRYLLIAGDATSDYLGYLGPPPENIVPSPMVDVQFSGETVSDSRLADADGDGRPDLAVGRWPVRSAAELSDIIERTLAYESGSVSDRVLFATDGSEATFSTIAARLISEAELAEQSVVQADGPTAAEVGKLWQDGAWLAAYVGHGSIDRWGKENIFSLGELQHLRGEAVPIVVQLTCLTGLFAHPEQDSLAEAMLRHKSGPVLVVAASSLTLSAQQEPFAVELLHRLQDSSVERAGDAFLGAKRALDIEVSDGLREISDTFALFGDPSAGLSVRKGAGQET